MAAGAISAMYAGAMTDAMPMPMPAMTRHSDQVPDAERERRQDRGDEEQDRAEEHHPGAAPAVGELAARATRRGRSRAARPRRRSPVSDAASCRTASSIASTAPLMTELSNPKRKPPTAAATARAIALFLCGFGGAAAPPVDPCGDPDACGHGRAPPSPPGRSRESSPLWPARGGRARRTPAVGAARRSRRVGRSGVRGEHRPMNGRQADGAAAPAPAAARDARPRRRPTSCPAGSTRRCATRSRTRPRPRSCTRAGRTRTRRSSRGSWRWSRPRASTSSPRCGPTARADTLPGALWRLYVLREWVRRDPATVADRYRLGVARRARARRRRRRRRRARPGGRARGRRRGALRRLHRRPRRRARACGRVLPGARHRRRVRRRPPRRASTRRAPCG